MSRQVVKELDVVSIEVFGMALPRSEVGLRKLFEFHAMPR
jgi:hypothetical protein